MLHISLNFCSDSYLWTFAMLHISKLLKCFISLNFCNASYLWTFAMLDISELLQCFISLNFCNASYLSTFGMLHISELLQCFISLKKNLNIQIWKWSIQHPLAGQPNKKNPSPELFVIIIIIVFIISLNKTWSDSPKTICSLQGCSVFLNIGSMFLVKHFKFYLIK